MVAEYKYFRGDPLYPFGHGLSFTNFQYSEILISDTEVTGEDTVKVKITLENTGEMGGDEVVQIYCRTLSSDMLQPVKKLIGFQRIYLEKGEVKTIKIPFSMQEAAIYNDELNDLAVEPVDYELQIGASSSDIRKVGNITVKKGHSYAN